MATRTALGRFPRGHRPWNDGTKGQGLSRPNRGSFGSPGRPGGKPVKPVGSKYWHAKDGEVYVKVAQPSRYAGRYSKSRLTERECWRPERIVNFEAVHGPVVRGLQVRRLLPLCNCPENLALITPAVGAILNKGHWTRPKKPWSSLPPDAEIRLAAVIAAVAFSQAMGYRRNLTRPCECGCGESVRVYGNYNHAPRKIRFRPGHAHRKRRPRDKRNGPRPDEGGGRG